MALIVAQQRALEEEAAQTARAKLKAEAQAEKNAEAVAELSAALNRAQEKAFKKDPVGTVEALNAERASAAAAGADVIPADFSEGMLAAGRKARPHLPFTFADALNLPFADGEFDVVTISFGLRNTQNTEKALAEMLRVVKSGGHLIVAEFSSPTWRPFRTIYTNYLMRALPWVARKTSSNPDAYIYLAESIRAWPDQEALAAKIKAAGWVDVTWTNLTGGVVAVHKARKP